MIMYVWCCCWVGYPEIYNLFNHLYLSFFLIVLVRNVAYILKIDLRSDSGYTRQPSGPNLVFSPSVRPCNGKKEEKERHQ